ncbi:hypothetical protein B0H17DRAFT_1126863 [Mycena rosella]|uniref:Uncharacterized protein n=1 Tax=Mycena rosella TaxID=1033263 RepID=A0AAD7GSV6_MYCRO|nr:hypothetical protein B0H17DRAFT_1126863 [Mycena rosella]
MTTTTLSLLSSQPPLNHLKLYNPQLGLDSRSAAPRLGLGYRGCAIAAPSVPSGLGGIANDDGSWIHSGTKLGADTLEALRAPSAAPNLMGVMAPHRHQSKGLFFNSSPFLAHPKLGADAREAFRDPSGKDTVPLNLIDPDQNWLELRGGGRFKQQDLI